MRIRYHSFLEYAIIKINKTGKNYMLEFKKPQRAVSQGQSAVFYDKNGEILGGGIIR
ncbi:MAG: aminomethyltransferase beta-barrel domain-containing protein [Candidatus Moraniibacteriota bacterium]